MSPAAAASNVSLPYLTNESVAPVITPLPGAIPVAFTVSGGAARGYGDRVRRRVLPVLVSLTAPAVHVQAFACVRLSTTTFGVIV